MIIEDIEIKIDVRERQKRVIDKSLSSSSLFTFHRNVPSGVLCFRMEEFGKREWDNSKKSIEEQFPSIFATLEVSASKRKQWQIEAKKAEIQREKERKLKQEQYEIKLSEHNKVNSLIANSNRWNKAQEIRKYADHLEAIGTDNAVVEWARDKADWIDPTTGKEDPILGEYTTEPPKRSSYW